MIENEMGYRGSKSEIKLPQPINKEISVKEQRVDGSWCFTKMVHALRPVKHLRCTLMGLERGYQVKIPSNLFFNRMYSSFLQVVNPWFITGFSDAEGSFSILIQPNVKLHTKYRVKAIFTIVLHKKDYAILEQIKHTLMVGEVTFKGDNEVSYRVESIKELEKVIDHFDKYPLISVKQSDYIIFKQCLSLMKMKEHLTKRGLLKIISLKTSLNLGLSSNLQEFFPYVESIPRPIYKFNGIPDPYWIAGFTSGDGSFNLKLGSNTTTSIGGRVQLRFSIGLHIRDLELIKGIASYFNLLEFRVNETNGGEYKNINTTSTVAQLQIVKFSDIYNIIIPFFDKYPILGVKSMDFKDFKKVSQMVNSKEHLTKKGFNKILEIKQGMNQLRK
jgi:hypothetical protein